MPSCREPQRDRLRRTREGGASSLLGRPILLEIFPIRRRLILLDRHDVALRVLEIQLAPDRHPGIILGAIVFLEDRIVLAAIEPRYLPGLGEGVVEGGDLVAQDVLILR